MIHVFKRIHRTCDNPHPMSALRIKLIFFLKKACNSKLFVVKCQPENTVRGVETPLRWFQNKYRALRLSSRTAIQSGAEMGRSPSFPPRQFKVIAGARKTVRGGESPPNRTKSKEWQPKASCHGYRMFLTGVSTYFFE